MYILNKIKDNIRKYGIINFFKRAGKKISHVVLGKVSNILFYGKYKKQLNEIVYLKQDINIFVQFPFFDFNMPNFQRFQQVAIALAENNNLFFYCTPNNIYDNVYGFKEVKKNLYLTNQYNLILKHEKIKRNIIFVSTDLKFTKNDIELALQRGDNVIYDYVDEIHEDIVGKFDEKLYERHKYILQNEKIRVIATADKLFEEVKKYRKNNFELIGNGVNLEDFKIDAIEEKKFFDTDFKIKEELEFCKKHKINILYYGVFAKWFDYDLIKFLSQDNDIGIVLIGPDYDLSLKKSDILNLSNVLYLGLVEYKNLKYYANLADILTIPFLVNDITNATSPVKLFEYMALKKPIITTNLKECKKYKSVIVADSKDDFLQNINNIKENEISIEMKEIIYKDACENSWKNKCTKILK